MLYGKMIGAGYMNKRCRNVSMAGQRYLKITGLSIFTSGYLITYAENDL